MEPAEAKDFLIKLLSGTEFKLTLAEANKLMHSYKWLFELDPSGQAPKPIMKEKGK